MNTFKEISNYWQYLLIVLIILLVAISFETAQQLYYIRRYEIIQHTTFFELFKYQAYRWLIWMAFSYALILYTKSKCNQSMSIADFYKHFLLIGGLVITDIFIISITQMLLSEGTFLLSMLVDEYLPFYTFQKAPAFTLGYISVAIILHFFYANRQLKIEVLKLEELRQISEDLYENLQERFNTKSDFLNIKVGNKQKIIAVEDISWVESDDYCVKVHTINSSVFVMRISLKELEQKLGRDFLRVHRGAIANMKMVKEYQNGGSSKLVLKDKTEISVSKSKVRIVKEFLSY